MSDDLGIQLFAAMHDLTEMQAEVIVAQSDNPQVRRLAAAAQAIITEREAAARIAGVKAFVEWVCGDATTNPGTRVALRIWRDTYETLAHENAALSGITIPTPACCVTARKEALRECYNAVCGEFIDKPIHDAGVRKCRDAIAKIIEGNEKWIKKK